MRIVIYISLLIFCSVHLNSHCQVNADNNCRDLLQKFVADMTRISMPENQKTYFMKYRVETFNKPKSNNQNSSMSGQVMLSGDKSSFESNIMSSYADDKNGFLILHNQRKIVWGPGGKNTTGADNFKQLASLQDSLVKLSYLSVCKNVTVAGKKNMKFIVLIPNEDIDKSLKVNRLEILFDLDKNMIYSVTTFYNEKSELDHLVVTYNDLNFNYSGSLFTNAYSKVLNSNGKLKAEYKGYELIDNRARN